MARELRYIPMPQLRRQYRRARQMKDDIATAALMLAATAATALMYFCNL